MISEIMNLDFERSIMDEVVMEPDMIEALNALDIDPDDHKYLSDILDPDNSGSIGIVEFYDGLKRLRGGPRRSDIVSVDLMIRSLQNTVQDISTRITATSDLKRTLEIIKTMILGQVNYL